MSKVLRIHTLFFVAALFMLAWPLSAKLTVPEKEEQLLFYIERNRDKDEVWYTVNLDESGSVNSRMPLKVFWMRKSEDSRRDPLTRIQKNFSYGIHSVEVVSQQDEAWSFKLAGYKDKEFELKKDDAGHFKVYTLSKQRELEVRKMYVEFDGGSFLAPSIAYVKLMGIDILTGQEISEFLSGKGK